ncbi:hypothetical protein BDV18DRAFT_118958 [Aspergillus unguis]
MLKTIQEALAHGQGSATSDGFQVKYVDTVEAYDKWAEVYDTDGNFLQALDTIEMRRLLPRFLTLIQAQARTQTQTKIAAEFSTSTNRQELKLVDLGCGTGRNTLQLAKAAPKEALVIGLDASPGMLEVARENLRANEGTKGATEDRIMLGLYDLLGPGSLPESLQRQFKSGGASGIISTLVLEHIPADTFFEGAAKLLEPGGYLLVTNMHAEMGAISQAGFVDVTTGTKIRPKSYAHEMRDVVAAAESVGFEVVPVAEGESLRERRIEEGMIEKLGDRAKKWMGVMVWFAICFRLK